MPPPGPRSPAASWRSGRQASEMASGGRAKRASCAAGDLDLVDRVAAAAVLDDHPHLVGDFARGGLAVGQAEALQDRHVGRLLVAEAPPGRPSPARASGPDRGSPAAAAQRPGWPSMAACELRRISPLGLPIRSITPSQASMHCVQAMHSNCRPSRMSMPVGQVSVHRPQSMQSPWDGIGLAIGAACRAARRGADRS